MSPFSTFSRVRSVRNQRLSVDESDRLFRFVHVTAMARRFSGTNEGQAMALKSKDRLAGRRPLEMLSTIPTSGPYGLVAAFKRRRLSTGLSPPLISTLNSA